MRTRPIGGAGAVATQQKPPGIWRPTACGMLGPEAGARRPAGRGGAMVRVHTFVCAVVLGACGSEPGSDPESDCVAMLAAPIPAPVVLHDLNTAQLSSARALGIPEPLESRRSAVPAGMVPLAMIAGIRLLPMSHSRPWVVPVMAERLEELRDRFHARLATLGLPAYPLVVSSALRSRGEQADLRTVNGNASRDSAHFFGTTVDLHYGQWLTTGRVDRALDAAARRLQGRVLVWRIADARASHRESRSQTHDCVNNGLKSHLGAVLGEMRTAGSLWALEEKRQPVFHITARE